MCIGGGKSSSPQQQPIPAPTPPTTFDYNAVRRENQRSADTAVTNAQSATMLSSTTGGGAFGSELGGMAAATPSKGY